MQTNFDLYAAAKEHQLKLLREADQLRLAKMTQTNRPTQTSHQPLLAELGRQLSTLGQRLEQVAGKQQSDVLAYSRK